MFIRQLHYLVALAEQRHFARAAEECHVSQPALSNGIHQLEDELNVRIVQRNRRFLGFTPEGEKVLQWARQTLSSLDGLRQEASLAQNVAGGHLAIGAVPSALRAASLLAGEYRRVIPDLTLEIYSLRTKEILQRLKQQELHLAIAYALPQQDPAFASLPLYDERFVLLSGNAPLAAKQPRLGLPDLARLPLCLFETGMHNRTLIDALFARAGIQAKVVVETNTISVIYEEVLKNGLYSILPQSAIPDYFVPNRLTITPLDLQATNAMILMRLEQESLSPIVASAWEITRKFDLQAMLGE